MDRDIPHLRHAALDWRAAAAWSRGQLDAPLAHRARLTTAPLEGSGCVYGSFQRRSDAPAGLDAEQRGSGGDAVIVGHGALWVLLELAAPSALTDADAPRLLNRYLRPVLRALTRVTGRPARYFGRDLVDIGGRAVAFAAYAHDRRSGRASVELFVSHARSALREGHASLAGKPRATLAELGCTVDAGAVGDAIAEAFATSYDLALAPEPAPPSPPPFVGESDEGPWTVTVESAIGRLGASPRRVGGAFMAARDAVEGLAAELADLPDGADLPTSVVRHLGPRSAALFGVRGAADLAALLEAARSEPAPARAPRGDGG